MSTLLKSLTAIKTASGVNLTKILARDGTILWQAGSLFDNGNLGISGSYISTTNLWSNFSSFVGSSSRLAPTVSVGTSLSITLVNTIPDSGYQAGSVYIANMIDLTNWSTLTFDGSVSDSGVHDVSDGGSIYMIISTSVADGYTAIKQVRLAEAKTIDVSDLSGSYYISFCIFTEIPTTANITINKLTLS